MLTARMWHLRANVCCMPHTASHWYPIGVFRPSNISHPGSGVCRYSGAGSVFLTNYRLVFVAKKPTPQVHAIELPLLFIDKHDVSQPIFGANNLHGTCRPVDAAAGELINWKLSFTNGGMGTMVPLFFASIEYIRVASRRRHEAPPEPEPEPDVFPMKQTAEPPAFLATALLDPNDPTKVYLTQPVNALDQQAKPQFPVV